MNCNVLPNRIIRRVLASACATGIATAFALSPSAHAGKVNFPDNVPPELQVEAGSHPFLVGHAIGTQNYVCVPSSTSTTGFAFVLFTPEATLFNDDGDQLITHFFSPNQDPSDPNTSSTVTADGAIRPTWQHSRDGSAVWAKLHPNGSVTVKQDAVDWLLLDRVGAEAGLTGGDILQKTTQIQRLNTAGGRPPKDGCSSASDLGKTAFQDYTADYFFYTNQ